MHPGRLRQESDSKSPCGENPPTCCTNVAPLSRAKPIPCKVRSTRSCRGALMRSSMAPFQAICAWQLVVAGWGWSAGGVRWSVGPAEPKMYGIKTCWKLQAQSSESATSFKLSLRQNDATQRTKGVCYGSLLPRWAAGYCWGARHLSCAWLELRLNTADISWTKIHQKPNQWSKQKVN